MVRFFLISLCLLRYHTGGFIRWPFALLYAVISFHYGKYYVEDYASMPPYLGASHAYAAYHSAFLLFTPLRLCLRLRFTISDYLLRRFSVAGFIVCHFLAAIDASVSRELSRSYASTRFSLMPICY